MLSVYAGSTVKSSAEQPAAVASSNVLQFSLGETTDGVETSFGGDDERLLCEEDDGGYFNE